MMFEFYFISTFPPGFWGFAGHWKRSNEKKKCAKCGAGTCFNLYMQMAGVVFQTIRKEIESVHVSFGKDGIMWVTLDKWLETTLHLIVDNWVEIKVIWNK